MEGVAAERMQRPVVEFTLLWLPLRIQSNSLRALGLGGQPGASRSRQGHPFITNPHDLLPGRQVRVRVVTWCRRLLRCSLGASRPIRQKVW